MVRPCSCPASDRSWQGGAKDKEHAMSQQLTTAVAVVGIDIGKNSFHVVGLDERGAIVLRQKWSRGQVEARLANMSPCLIGMEACVGAHHLSRKLKMLGHDARLMPAKYVRPYSKGQKNDFRDAEAIAEAVQRPTMKFVATKSADQLDLQALHRVRERLVSQRTGIINQIRAFLLERANPWEQTRSGRVPTLRVASLRPKSGDDTLLVLVDRNAVSRELLEAMHSGRKPASTTSACWHRPLPFAPAPARAR
jgi:transposase